MVLIHESLFQSVSPSSLGNHLIKKGIHKNTNRDRATDLSLPFGHLSKYDLCLSIFFRFFPFPFIRTINIKANDFLLSPHTQDRLGIFV